MSTSAGFSSPLAGVLAHFLAAKVALGRRYATERAVVQSLDAFLTNDKAEDLTQENFERWCRTFSHLTSGVRRFRMRIVRNLCIYRQRCEPGCFVPDTALFPPMHQCVRPYLFTEREITRLVNATATLQAPPAYPLRSLVFRLGVVLLRTAGLRRGELLRLAVGDYNPSERTLFIRGSKFHKSRLL